MGCAVVSDALGLVLDELLCEWCTGGCHSGGADSSVRALLGEWYTMGCLGRCLWWTVCLVNCARFARMLRSYRLNLTEHLHVGIHAGKAMFDISSATC
jgi:hypothetical protein